MQVRYVTLVGTPDGGSRFTDVEVGLAHPMVGPRRSRVAVSPPLPGTQATFVALPDGLVEIPPHPAPRRQVLVIVEGVAEIETSDGATRRFGPGDVVVVEDTEGAGHITRTVSSPVRALVIPMMDPPGP